MDRCDIISDVGGHSSIFNVGGHSNIFNVGGHNMTSDNVKMLILRNP